MQAEFTGLGVITLDALTRREWVKEDELATELKVHPKVMRRVLRYFEQVPTPLAGSSFFGLHALGFAWTALNICTRLSNADLSSAT